MGAESMRPGQIYIQDVKAGDELPVLTKTCTPRQLVMWAAASGDFYEIHYDVEFARAMGLPGLVVHGALKNAFLGQLLHDWVAPEGRIVRYGCSYRGLDYPGEELHCGGTVTGISRDGGAHLVELDIWLRNERQEITTPGTAVVELPSHGDVEEEP
jgi:acyl dehydratase